MFANRISHRPAHPVSTAHRNMDGLSDELIARYAPSVFAEQAHHSRADSYGFIPTSAVLAGLRAEGFLPIYAAQSRTRIADKREFTKHMLRFQHPNIKALEVGDVIPEIVLVNSHDGTSSYQISAGLFRLACSNGMMVSAGTMHDVRVRHTRNVVENVIEGSFEIINDVPAIAQSISEMRSIQLPEPAQRAFAEGAALLRWGEPDRVPVTPDSLLLSRRNADAGNDLWRVFNRVQENLVKGGLAGRNSQGTRTHTRGVNSVNADIKLNRDLWELAANVVSQIGGAK